MKHALRLLPAALLLGLAACQSSAGQETSHWNIESLNHRLAYHFLGYRPDLARSYRDHQYQEKQNINLGLRRHLLNNNPLNPTQADDPSLHAPRPPHSVLPNPPGYFHLESIVTGLGLLAMTNAFIPLPIGSVLGTLEEGGFEEFAAGIRNTVTGSFHDRLDQPPAVEEFRVRNQILR